MMWAVVIGIAVVYVFVYALCKAASDEDDRKGNDNNER